MHPGKHGAVWADAEEDDGALALHVDADMDAGVADAGGGREAGPGDGDEDFHEGDGRADEGEDGLERMNGPAKKTGSPPYKSGPIHFLSDA